MILHKDIFYLILGYFNWNQLLFLRLVSHNWRQLIDQYPFYQIRIKNFAATKIQKTWRNKIVSIKCNCQNSFYCNRCNEYNPTCYYHCMDVGCANHEPIEFPSNLCKYTFDKPIPTIHYIFKKNGKYLVSCCSLKRWEVKYTYQQEWFWDDIRFRFWGPTLKHYIFHPEPQFEL